MGISAWHLAKKHDVDFFQKSFKYSVVYGLIGVLAVCGIGHAQGQFLMDVQPMKMAAAEAHWETEDPASFVAIAASDEEAGENTFSIEIPNMLSFMTYNSFSGEVKGIHDLQAEYEAQYGEGNYVPQVTPLFWSFRAMVGAGGLMVLLTLIGVVLLKTGKLQNSKLYLKVMLFAMALPYIANTTGWLITEMGRQPWIVYGLQKTAEGISTVVPASYILISMVGFTLVYGILAVVDVMLLVKYGKKSPEALEEAPTASEEVSLWT